MSNNIKKIAYAVLSCDPYSDIWDAYGEMFHRFWPDCPYDCYLASHHKTFDKYGFKSILIGDDVSWSHGLLILLDVLEEKGYEYAMIAFDDFLLCQRVDTPFITKAIDIFISEKGNCLRFDPIKTSRCYKHNEYYRKMGVKIPYRVVLGFTLWNIKTLRLITVEGESAWQFEKNATERSFSYDSFYCTRRRQFHWINLINKRKLDITEYNKLKMFIPDATFDREQVYVKGERFKTFFLEFFMKYCPTEWQYPIYKKLTKPINI